MSDENFDNEQEDLAGLRKAARDGKAAQAELERMKRELLFAKAGIDTDTKLGKMLFRTFEGDSLDELRSEAEEIGLIGQPEEQPSRGRPSQQDQYDDFDDMQQQQFRRTMASGRPAGAVDTPSPDPMDGALRDFHEDVRRGVPSRQAGLAAIDKVLVAGANKDPRVIFNERDWFNQASIDSASRNV